MKFMKRFIGIFCIIFALFGTLMLSSCEEESIGSGYTFVIDRTNMNMSVGDRATVSWSVIPTPESDSFVTWESSDENIVTCTDGVINAVGEGRAIVTATHSTGLYQVISIAVKNDNNKLYMLEGESLQVKASDINSALQGSECISSDEDIAVISKNDAGVLITASKKGKCDIRLENEGSSIIYYDLVVLSKENSGVNITTDECPLTVNYDTGRYQSAVRITNISVEKRDTREFLDQNTVQVELAYEIEKVFDSDGDESLNPTRFMIAVYSTEAEDENPLRELEVHTGWTTVASGEIKRFVYTFNVDFELGDGERSYTFTIKEIEAKE